MTSPNAALERSLREGPPDENSYRPQALDMTVASQPSPARDVRLERVVPAGPVARTRTTSRRHYLAASIVIVIVIGSAALGFLDLPTRPSIGGPAPAASSSPASPDPGSRTPSTRASPGQSGSTIVTPPLTETFVSPRNGFSVMYPAGWIVTAATTRWGPNEFAPIGNPALDAFMKAGQARLLVASQPLSPGQTEDDWVAAYFHPFEGGHRCGGDRTTWPRLQIDGQSGYLDVVDCPLSASDSKIADRDVMFSALAFAGGRVYQIRLDGDVDRAYFDGVLATIRLSPSQAVD